MPDERPVGEALEGITVDIINAAVSQFMADKYKAADPNHLVDLVEASMLGPTYDKTSQRIKQIVGDAIVEGFREMERQRKAGQEEGEVEVSVSLSTELSYVACMSFVIGLLAGRSAATKQLLEGMNG